MKGVSSCSQSFPRLAFHSRLTCPRPSQRMRAFKATRAANQSSISVPPIHLVSRDPETSPPTLRGRRDAHAGLQVPTQVTITLPEDVTIQPAVLGLFKGELQTRDVIQLSAPLTHDRAIAAIPLRGQWSFLSAPDCIHFSAYSLLAFRLYKTLALIGCSCDPKMGHKR